MNFFDVLMTDNEVVTSNDMVRACMDDTFEGITIQVSKHCYRWRFLWYSFHEV